MTDAEKVARLAVLDDYKLSEWKPKTYPCGSGHECAKCGEFTMARELWPVCRKPNMELPDYLGDRNAILSLIARLPADAQYSVVAKLIGKASKDGPLTVGRIILTATTSQLCEAVLA